MKIINNPHSQESGSSMMEVLVSAFVLAIGLLGTLAMQAQAVVKNQSSYSLTQAVVLANDMAEKMRANSAAVYSVARNATVNTVACQACSPADLRANDLHGWLNLVKGTDNTPGRLPQGAAQIEDITPAGTAAGLPKEYLITLFFNDTKKAGDSSFNQGEQSYSLRVRI